MTNNMTEEQVTKGERFAVIGIVGAISLYLLYLGKVDAGIGFAMNIVTYFLSRKGV